MSTSKDVKCCVVYSLIRLFCALRRKVFVLICPKNFEEFLGVNHVAECTNFTSVVSVNYCISVGFSGWKLSFWNVMIEHLLLRLPKFWSVKISEYFSVFWIPRAHQWKGYQWVNRHSVFFKSQIVKNRSLDKNFSDSFRRDQISRIFHLRILQRNFCSHWDFLPTGFLGPSWEILPRLPQRRRILSMLVEVS